MSKRVAVLMGGISPEREVSLNSGKGCLQALREVGYDAHPVVVTHDIRALVEALTPAPDVAFNVLHGRYGEDGSIQGLLELMRVPYTGSGLLPSALGMHKPASRAMFAAAGLRMAEAFQYSRTDHPAGEPLPRPYVIKPLNQGSSVGVRLIFPGDNIDPWDDETWAFGNEVLVERYIPGREVQVAVLGSGAETRALGAIEIRTERRFYDYVAKYTPGESTHLMPAPIHRRAYDEVMALAAAAHRTLGCRGVSRVDYRYEDTAGEPGAFYLLEVNTQPGMTATSLVPEIAAHAGIPFDALVGWMVEHAQCDA